MKNRLPTKKVDNEGNIEYVLDGYTHREDGPAVEYVDGYRAWYILGKLHREDGPAREFGGGYMEWWLHGEKYPFSSQEEFERFLKLRVLW